jgi:hypothetical protein
MNRYFCSYARQNVFCCVVSRDLASHIERLGDCVATAATAKLRDSRNHRLAAKYAVRLETQQSKNIKLLIFQFLNQHTYKRSD